MCRDANHEYEIQPYLERQTERQVKMRQINASQVHHFEPLIDDATPDQKGKAGTIVPPHLKALHGAFGMNRDRRSKKREPIVAAGQFIE